MPRIAGVKTQKDNKGNVIIVTVIVKEHRKAMPVTRKFGPFERAQFEKDCEAGITPEELRDHLYAFIRRLPWENNPGALNK